MNKRSIFVLALAIIGVAGDCVAQSRNAKYEAYIAEYSNLAIEAREKYGIPASITLAQGLLESGAGQSRLAKECKNHFGIKCGGSWYGKSMTMDDDAVGECFRCYGSAKESFSDHAEFLKRQRYAFLFDYKVTDYKSWAEGLKKAGYATDPRYPEKLIGIIELYDLARFDGANSDKKTEIADSQKEKTENTKNEKTRKKSDKTGNDNGLFGYVETQNNRVRCIKLVEEDSYANIAKKMGIGMKALLFFNDLPKEVALMRGDYVYLAPKRAQAKGISDYTVRAGDSMHSIAQEYGIRLKSLYKMNNLDYGTEAEVGMVLKLHK